MATKKGCCCTWRCAILITSAIIALIFLTIGILELVFATDLLQLVIKQQTHLAKKANGEDNEVLRMYRNPPYQIQMEVWTVSVQNAEDVVQRGHRPVVQEKGPYTFNMKIHKTNVSFTANNTRLLYRNEKTYFFDRNQSCADCELTDTVMVPNLLFQKILDLATGKNWFVRNVIEQIAKAHKESVFVNVTVGEILFDGYNDRLVDKLCTLLPSFCRDNQIPARIGLFYGQNGTDDGVYEVDTGISDVNLLGKVYSFRGMKGKLSEKFWYNDTARLINGTDGELFAPNILIKENVEIFLGPLCRSFQLHPISASSSSGMPAIRYAQPDDYLEYEKQKAQGFCNPNSPDYFHNATIQKADCAPSGLLDMSSCLPGNPRIFLSNAHFLNARPELRVDGMAKPSESSDQSYFDIEPMTGSVVGLQQKSQLNVGMLRGEFSMTKNMRDMIVPIVWLNQSAKIDAGTRAKLQSVYSILTYAFIGAIIMAGVGALTLLGIAGFIVWLKIAENRRVHQQFVRSADEMPTGDGRYSEI